MEDLNVEHVLSQQSFELFLGLEFLLGCPRAIFHLHDELEDFLLALLRIFSHYVLVAFYPTNLPLHGDLLINENQINRILKENLSTSKIVEELENFVGKAWDNALEPFRLGREKSLAATDKLSV